VLAALPARSVAEHVTLLFPTVLVLPAPQLRVVTADRASVAWGEIETVPPSRTSVGLTVGARIGAVLSIESDLDPVAQFPAGSQLGALV